MFIGTSICNWKCCKEANISEEICQNYGWYNATTHNIEDEKIIKRYIDNSYTDSIVIGGLEPFAQYDELYEFIKKFRGVSDDTIIIYTGYNKNEIKDEVNELSSFNNIIVKFGRFIPNQQSHFDEVLGVSLASDNQYAEIIS